MSKDKGDLISRTDAHAELSGLCESWEDEDSTSYQAMDIVDNLPSVDAVEVVRCKDCVYFGAELFCNKLSKCDGSPLIVSESNFCCFGERKDDAK